MHTEMGGPEQRSSVLRRGLAEGPDRKEAPSAIRVVLFRLFDRDFAFRLEDVVEILPAVALTAVPDSPAWLRGMVNLRGRTLRAIDLRERLTLPARELDPDPDSAIIVAQTEAAEQVGFIVDRVLEVVVDFSMVFEPMDSPAGRGHPVRGVTRRQDRMIVVLDVDRLSESSSYLTLPESLG